MASVPSTAPAEPSPLDYAKLTVQEHLQNVRKDFLQYVEKRLAALTKIEKALEENRFEFLTLQDLHDAGMYL